MAGIQVLHRLDTELGELNADRAGDGLEHEGHRRGHLAARDFVAAQKDAAFFCPSSVVRTAVCVRTWRF